MSLCFPTFRRSGLLALGLVVPSLLLGVYCLAQEKKQEMQKTALQQFKNIKVLKTLPADKLIPVMHDYNNSLGVKCDFCHIVGENHTGFEKDDKRTKIKARQMIIMTEDLNKHYRTVDKKVTCFTCHKGQAEPANHPEAKEETR